jgi:hypothetical protein
LLKFVGKIYKKPGKNIERFVIYLKNQIKGLKVLQYLILGDMGIDLSSRIF